MYVKTKEGHKSFLSNWSSPYFHYIYVESVVKRYRYVDACKKRREDKLLSLSLLERECSKYHTSTVAPQDIGSVELLSLIPPSFMDCKKIVLTLFFYPNMWLGPAPPLPTRFTTSTMLVVYWPTSSAGSNDIMYHVHEESFPKKLICIEFHRAFYQLYCFTILQQLYYFLIVQFQS